jgi:AcrR family transcriptional regulator
MRARRKKVPDPEVFEAIVRVMMRVGPGDLTLAAIAAEAGLTAGALVQRFGSKRGLMLAHARYAAATGDIGLAPKPARKGSALRAIRVAVEPFAELAASPEAALRNLAYLQRDLADPALYKNLLSMNRKARKHYEELVSAAIVARELRPATNPSLLARMIEVTLIGSFLSWAIYREGPAARWLRRDLDAVLHAHVEPATSRTGRA